MRRDLFLHVFGKRDDRLRLGDPRGGVDRRWVWGWWGCSASPRYGAQRSSDGRGTDDLSLLDHSERYLHRRGHWRQCLLEGDCDADRPGRSEEHTSELQSRLHLVCRLLLEKKKHNTTTEHSEWNT